jgi:hypothetical protein
MPATLNGTLLPGWMERDDALDWLQQQCWFDPPLQGSQAEDIWNVYRNRVEALGTRSLPTVNRGAVAASDRQHVESFKRRFRGDPEVIDVVGVDPMNLVVYQLYVCIEKAQEHAASHTSWCKKCLVMDRPISRLPIRVEDGTVKITLPHAEHMLGLQPNGAFVIQQGGGFVSVVEFQGRTVLKAGYHRCFAFAQSAMKAPDANDKFMLVAVTRSLPPPLTPMFPRQGLRATVFGSRPPLFSDFFDSNFAMAVKLRKKRYEAHFRILAVDEP